MRSQPSGIFKALGPGLLFAAAAVGVSHLVQSTRAGAQYGLGLVVVVIIANLLKYPAFRFGPHYAAATGTSLLQGYRRQGHWALVLYALLTLGTMFTVQAAVTLVTAGLLKATVGLELSPVILSVLILVVCSGLLAIGKYRLLELLTKILVAVLTLSTLAATLMALPRLDLSTFSLGQSAFADPKSLFFVVALAGWMPSAIDVSVWQSLWTIAKKKAGGAELSLSDSTFDFHVGYIGTAILALCFLVMGAAVMYGTGTKISPSAGGFAAQVIGLYTETLGDWSRPIIGASALAVMFSTTLTVLDGFPRALSHLWARFQSDEEAEAPEKAQDKPYWASLLLIGLGALLVIFYFLKSLKGLVDVATTLSFLTAPILAVLNHRAVISKEVPASLRPATWLQWMSLICIAAQGAFALWYLWLKYLK